MFVKTVLAALRSLIDHYIDNIIQIKYDMYITQTPLNLQYSLYQYNACFDCEC